MNRFGNEAIASLHAILENTISDHRGRIWSASQIFEKLQSNDILAYVAGGAIRDSIRSVKPNDLDIVAGAHISRTAEVLREWLGEDSILIYNEPLGSLRVGLSHKSYFDIGMFRDIESIEGHKSLSDVVYGFSGDPASDARTVDFAINAMYWRPDIGLLDPTGRGEADCVEGLLELSSDPRKVAIDRRLTLRLALFANKGFRPTERSKDFFQNRIDGDIESFGETLPAFLDEVTRGSKQLKAGIVSFCAEQGASKQTGDLLRQAMDAHLVEYESYWGAGSAALMSPVES